MNGEVAQLIALVAHGNLFLAAGGEPPELFPANSTFNYVQDVVFPDTGPGTAAWFARRRGEGVERLWLELPETDPRLSGFVGAVRGAAWSDGPRRAIWTPHWSVLDRRAPDRRIWHIEYAETRLVSALPAPPSLEGLPAELDGALRAAIAVANRHEFLPTFVPWFEGALAALTADEPTFAHHPDLVPAGWSLGARRLLAAAERAWVFGAMGSWNDVGFDDDDLDREYTAVTARLWAAVCASVRAGANAALAVDSA